MAHPMNHARQHHVEKSRAHHLLRGYKHGGAVKSAAIGNKALALHKEEHAALHAEGHGSKHRMDRPKRARGGKVGKHKGASGKTIVNVITGGHPGAPPPMAPPMGIAGPPPGAMPAPPMAAKPPMPMPPPGAGIPPGGPPMPMRKHGGRVNQGSPVYEASKRAGTHVQHSDGKDDGKDIGRGRVVTFACGGKVKSFRAYGGRVESPKGVAKDTRLPGGSGGGEARLVKAKRAAREYHGPD